MEAAQVWRAALERLRAHTTPGAFSAWFSRTEGVELAGATLTVAVRTTFAREHLRARFGEQVLAVVSEVLGRRAEVVLMVGGKGAKQEQPRPGSPGARVARHATTGQAPHSGAGSAGSRGAKRARSSKAAPMERGAVLQPPLDRQPVRDAEQADAPPSRYTFETFVVGAGNMFVFAAAQEVARAPGVAYNPLFVYGGAGLGKTHLLRALAYAARAAGCSVAFVNAGDFAEEVVAALNQQALEALRTRYRSVDVLLVDDAQALAGGEVVEEELLNTFNALHEAGRQIVLSSDRVPSALRQIHARLRSRFEWGLIVDLHVPEYEQRLAILRAKAAALDPVLDERALRALAAPEYESVRALEGALERVVATSRLLGRRVDEQVIRETLRELAMGTPPRGLDSATVLDTVSRHFALTREEICGPTREQRVALARQMAMYLLRAETATSFGAIGRLLGGRDHSTVMHGCARIGGALVSDARLRMEVEAIRAELGQ